MLAAGSVVGGRYRIVRLLGGGGMKMVYLAEDARLANRPCALAEMIEHLADPAERQVALQAFAREAEMLARLDHPRIPQVFDHFSEQNHHYLVMQYVEGETLEECLAKFPHALDEQLVIDLGLQVLEALDYLHNRTPPVVFRDLKPSNLIHAESGQIKLIDFGIARHFQPKKTATMVGTQGYAPPEQYEGKAEPRSDLYALGATLFQLLTGWDPTKHSPFSFPPLRQLRLACDPALAELLTQALIPEVDRRIADASEFRNRLRSLNSRPLATAALASAAQAAPPPVHSVMPDTARCPRCARTIPLDPSLCPYCGARLMTPSAAQEQTVLIAPARRQSRALRHLVVGAAALAVLAGAGAGIYYVREQLKLAEAIRGSHQLFDKVTRCASTSCEDGLLKTADYDMARLAANAGDAEAQWLLGRASGNRKDYAEAVKWYRKAAEQGNARGEVDLGYRYEQGQGVAQDYVEAAKWYRKAAEQGNARGEAAWARCTSRATVWRRTTPKR